MAETKEDLEKKINQTAAEYFTHSVEGERDPREPRYQKLWVAIYTYCTDYKYKAYRTARKGFLLNNEICEVVDNCRRYYQPERGKPFLHYLNASFSGSLPSAALLHIKLDEQKRHGPTMSPTTRRRVKTVVELFELLKKEGKDPASPDGMDRISWASGFSVEKVQKYLDLSKMQEGVGDSIDAEADSDASGSLFDVLDKFLPDDPRSRQVPFDETVVMNEKIGPVLAVFDKLYNISKESKKSYLRQLLTLKVLRLYHIYEGAAYSFLDKEMVRNYMDGGKLPTQREIALACGKGKNLSGADAHASMTMIRFKAKVRKELENMR